MELRESNLEKLAQNHFDVLVVGGGINGAVCASALAAKGAKVALIDKGDFASVTSQESSNLVWGGIKYMENGEFFLVRNLCKSRNHLMKNYPSTVQEIRFFTTLAKGFRHKPFFLWLGTWVYWLIGNCYTKRPRYLFTKKIAQEEKEINMSNCAGGVEYSDAYLHDNDARFVFSFIRDSINRGAIVANYVESLGAKREKNTWVSEIQDTISQRKIIVRSKVLINATGPYVDEHNKKTEQTTLHRHVLSKGIHLTVKKITPYHRVLAFFADDGRLFFVIPMGPVTCIGTTDTRVEKPNVTISEEDREFVLDNVNQLFQFSEPITKEDIIAERCGVRPLVVKGQVSAKKGWMQLSRKHVVETHEKEAHISIFGGKLTDCLNVGEEVAKIVQKLGVPLVYSKYQWYGEAPSSVRQEFFHQARLMDLDKLTHKNASEKISTRIWRRYGPRAFSILEEIRSFPQKAQVIIEETEYIQAELELAAQQEMIVKLEDFLRRRSKIALVISRQKLKESPGLFQACQILFGEKAQIKYDEYFGEGLE